ncbi:MAG: hypothetical protein AAFV78_17335, partial [Bacteroidota bacterium]
MDFEGQLFQKNLFPVCLGENHKSLLFFIAIHFPDVGLNEFQWLVRRVLDVGYDQRRKPKGTQEIMPEGPDQGLHEMWDEYPEYWMEKVYMTVDFSASSNGKIIFEDSSLRRSATRYLEKHFFFFSLKCFEVLAASHIWSHPSASRELIRSFILLMAKKAATDPHAYGQQIPLRLLEVINNPESRFNIRFPFEEEDKSLQQKNDSLKAVNHPVLIALLKEMLDIETLVPQVKNFFRVLIDQRQHEIILKVIPRLVYQLQFPVSFWLRQVIERADAAHKSTAYKQLLTIAIRNQRPIFEILEEVSILWPKLSKKFDRYSIVETYGLTFLYEYLNETQVGRLEDLGNYPSNFPLFYQWHEISDAQIEEQAKILGNGLFHPGRIHVL